MVDESVSLTADQTFLTTLDAVLRAKDRRGLLLDPMPHQAASDRTPRPLWEQIEATVPPADILKTMELLTGCAPTRRRAAASKAG